MTLRLAAFAFLAPLLGISPAAAGGTLIPAQLSMGAKVPGGTKVPRQQAVTLTPEEGRQLVTMMSHMSSKQRRKLNKTIKSMTPAQRRQFTIMVKHQLAANGTASQVTKRGR